MIRKKKKKSFAFAGLEEKQEKEQKSKSLIRMADAKFNPRDRRFYRRTADLGAGRLVPPLPLENPDRKHSQTVLCQHAGLHQSGSDHRAGPPREPSETDCLCPPPHFLQHQSSTEERQTSPHCFCSSFPEIGQEFGREKASGLAYSLMVDGPGSLRTGVAHRHQLEKTLENPLDCKEIEVVNPKPSQSQVDISTLNVHWKDGG